MAKYSIYSEAEWTEINKVKSKDEIKEAIWETTRNLPLPLVDISIDDCVNDFDDLNKMDCRELISTGNVFSRYPYNYPIGDKYISSSNVGNKSSNFFHQDLRYKCDSINSPSPIRTWENKKFFFSMVGALWSLKCKEVNSDILRTCITMRKYVASQFRPSAAKALYQHFNAENVLDFSSGWGDRLSAAMATDSVKHYTGIDPNTDLFEGYNEQIKQFGVGKDIQIHNYPAEDFLKGHTKRDYDFIFTSPPYFIAERYSKKDTQSWVRYKKIDSWLNNFLFVVIQEAVKRLKAGGHLAVNISDVYCNHTVNKICDPMNDFILSLQNMERVDNVNYQMAKRVNSKSNQSGTFVEPVWIWKKL